MANKKALPLTHEELGIFSSNHSKNGFEESKKNGSATSATTSPDTLLSWIDSLRARANETIKIQEKEARRFSQFSRQEVLRQKYRNRINAELFIPLKQLAHNDFSGKVPGTHEELDEIDSSSLNVEEDDALNLIGDFARPPDLILENHSSADLSDDDIIEISSESDINREISANSESKELSGSDIVETDNESFMESERFGQVLHNGEEDLLMESDSKIELLEYYGQSLWDHGNESVVGAQEVEGFPKGYLQNAPVMPLSSAACSHDSAASSAFSELFSEDPQVPPRSRESDLDSAMCSPRDDIHNSVTSSVSLDILEHEPVHLFGHGSLGTSTQEGDLANTDSDLVEHEGQQSRVEIKEREPTAEGIHAPERKKRPQDEALHYDLDEFALVAGAALKEKTSHDDPSTSDLSTLTLLGKEAALHPILNESELLVEAPVTSAPSVSAESSKVLQSPRIVLSIPGNVTSLSSASLADTESESVQSRASSPNQFDTRGNTGRCSSQPLNNEPVFRTVYESKPEEQLAALRVMERKYGFKLKAVHDLEHQLGIAVTTDSELDGTLYYDCQDTPANEKESTLNISTSEFEESVAEVCLPNDLNAFPERVAQDFSQPLHEKAPRSYNSLSPVEDRRSAMLLSEELMHAGNIDSEFSFPHGAIEHQVIFHDEYPPIFKPLLRNIQDELQSDVEGTCGSSGAFPTLLLVPLAAPTGEFNTGENASDNSSVAGDSFPEDSGEGKQHINFAGPGYCAARGRLVGKEAYTKSLALLNDFLINFTSRFIDPFARVGLIVLRTRYHLLNNTRRLVADMRIRRAVAKLHDDNAQSKPPEIEKISDRELGDSLLVETTSGVPDLGTRNRSMHVSEMTPKDGTSSGLASPQKCPSSLIIRVKRAIDWMNCASPHIDRSDLCRLLVLTTSECWKLLKIPFKAKSLLGLPVMLPAILGLSRPGELKSFQRSAVYHQILKKTPIRKYRLQLIPLLIKTISFKAAQRHRNHLTLRTSNGKFRHTKRQLQGFLPYPGDIEIIIGASASKKCQKRTRLTISKYGYAHRIAKLAFPIPRHENLDTLDSHVSSVTIDQAESIKGKLTGTSTFTLDRSPAETGQSYPWLPASPAAQNRRLAHGSPSPSCLNHHSSEILEESQAGLTNLSSHISWPVRLEDTRSRSDKRQTTRKREVDHSKDHAAFRTRSRSPIKRSLSEILADTENLSHKRGRIARRNKDDQTS